MLLRERRIIAGLWVVLVALGLMAAYYLVTISGVRWGHGRTELHRLEDPGPLERESTQEGVPRKKISPAVNETTGLEVKRGKDEAKNKTGPLPVRPPQIGCMDLENIDKDKALVIGYRKKEKGFLTIGITCAKRKNASYLRSTLQSLIGNANEEERSRLRIVVFACDLNDEDRQATRDIVSRGFPEHVRSGLLQLVQAGRSFYPPLDHLKRTFNDPAERVRWRSKENIDNVFLFAYSARMSEYYMLLDDDLVTLPGYLGTIRNFVAQHRGDDWFLLDISEKGTGKLFRDEDLPVLSRYLVQFYQEQPVDLLVNAMMRLRGQKKHYVVTPPLFKHMGVVSTLGLKNTNRGG